MQGTLPATELSLKDRVKHMTDQLEQTALSCLLCCDVEFPCLFNHLLNKTYLFAPTSTITS